MSETLRRLRTPAAAEYVGLSPSTLEKFRVNGGGPIYYKSGQKIVVYETHDLDAWLHARRQLSTSDTPQGVLSSQRSYTITSEHGAAKPAGRDHNIGALEGSHA